MSDRWRGVVAALLNPELRAALAELPTAPLTEARRTRAFARLEELGLVRPDGDGWTFDDTALRAVLAEGAPVKPTGPARFLDRDGRIDRYPLSAADRHQLLLWVADQVLPIGEVWSERDVNERLERFAPGGDVAALRRYLVDAGLVERTSTGSEYARVGASDD
ncbi:DUF2087 domain-containing protein [Microbacterium sp. RU33B]|uniref:DUF2087 domain-containing protein n=1 Tax=Microbacterium sp. RU33B TaxID=1907390 RepID=UPI0009655E9B|nr:DUF2087 domain-containing protein [Microbacterium sp. RU33B]SIT75602.1 hypothetical protein SAMN05880545_1484 [Microbacterium sp. RU33B]